MGFVKILQLGRFLTLEKQVVAGIISPFVQKVKKSKPDVILLFCGYTLPVIRDSDMGALNS